MENKPKITIAIVHYGNFEIEWITKVYIPLVMQTVDYCTKNSFLCKIPSLPANLDTLVNDALSIDNDYIFFINKDIIIERPSNPNLALEMLYQTMNRDPNSREGKIVVANSNMLSIDNLGMNCILINMNVFREIGRPWFKDDMKSDINSINGYSYFFDLVKKHGYDIRTRNDIMLSKLIETKVKSDGLIELIN